MNMNILKYKVVTLLFYFLLNIFFLTGPFTLDKQWTKVNDASSLKWIRHTIKGKIKWQTAHFSIYDYTRIWILEWSFSCHTAKCYKIANFWLLVILSYSYILANCRNDIEGEASCLVQDCVKWQWNVM